MIKSHTEMAHILGLDQNPFPETLRNTGWTNSESVSSLRRRFAALHDNAVLNFHLLNDKKAGEVGSDVSRLQDGEYIGYSADWLRINTTKVFPFSGHAYSFHAVKEGDVTHFIYVNSGEPHLTRPDMPPPANTLVFTVPNTEAEAFAKEMAKAAQSSYFQGRERISEFLNRELQKQANNPDDPNVRSAKALNEVITKKNQKVGNCSLANSNISMLLQMAANRMTSDRRAGQHTSFRDACVATREQYKNLRRADRIAAIEYLLNSKDKHHSGESWLYNYLSSMMKLNLKGIWEPEKDYLKELVQQAGHSEDNILKLISPLISEDFFLKKQSVTLAYVKQKNPNERNPDPALVRVQGLAIDMLKRVILKGTFSKLPEQKQCTLIEKDSSLLEYALPQVQKQFLDRDYSRYCIYVSSAVLGSHQPPSTLVPDNTSPSIYTFQRLAEETSNERKTSTIKYPGKSAGQKEMFINNEMRALCSYARANDTENMKKAFESMCLASCERRFTLPGRGNYSSDTHSATWLINKFQANDEAIVYLRGKLNINPDQLKQRFDDIIARKDQIINNRAQTHSQVTSAYVNEFLEVKRRFRENTNHGTEENQTVQTNSPS